MKWDDVCVAATIVGAVGAIIWVIQLTLGFAWNLISVFALFCLIIWGMIAFVNGLCVMYKVLPGVKND